MLVTQRQTQCQSGDPWHPHCYTRHNEILYKPANLLVVQKKYVWLPFTSCPTAQTTLNTLAMHVVSSSKVNWPSPSVSNKANATSICTPGDGRRARKYQCEKPKYCNTITSEPNQNDRQGSEPYREYVAQMVPNLHQPCLPRTTRIVSIYRKLRQQSPQFRCGLGRRGECAV